MKMDILNRCIQNKKLHSEICFLLNALNSVCNDDIDFKIIEADAMKGQLN